MSRIVSYVSRIRSTIFSVNIGCGHMDHSWFEFSYVMVMMLSVLYRVSSQHQVGSGYHGPSQPMGRMQVEIKRFCGSNNSFTALVRIK